MSEEKKDLEKDVVLASSETSEESALDFSELDSLKETNFERDPWYQTAGLAIARFLAKAGLWILGILYDCIKYLLLVVKYILGAVLMIIPGIYIVGRKAVMMFNDMDWAGKLSFIVMGASQLKRKQWLDGVVFLVVEIAFLFYMFVPISGGVGAGVSAINAFIHLGENSTDTRPELIFGFYAWIILIGFMVVYVLSLKGAYDSYMITAADKYKRARMEGIHVLNHPEIYHGKQKSDGTCVDFARMTHLSINRTLKQEYGFDALTARVVSRIAWSKCADPIALGYDNEGNFAIGNVFKSDADAWSKTQAFLVILWEKVLWLFRLIKTFYYNKIYNPCRNFVMARLYWFKPIERYCYWYLEKPKEKYGRYVVVSEEKLALIRFSHKYDKYNDYLATIRDTKALATVFKDGGALYDAIFGRDALSRKNGEVELNETAKLSVRKRVSSVIGTFEVSFPLGKKITSKAISIINEYRGKKGLKGEELRSACVNRFVELGEYYASYQEQFIEKWHDAPIRSAERTIAFAKDPSILQQHFDLGKGNFLAACEEEGILKNDGLALYSLFQQYSRIAISGGSGAELLERFGRRYERQLKSMRAIGYHGQPVTSLRRVKQFADEKFAVSVLALPVIGALVVTIVPLLCSIFVAFTNWDSDHFTVFNWDPIAWGSVFDMFGSETGGASYGYTFVRLLGWTIVWAICSTFSCYILGIIVALLINRKGLKFPRFWRTMLIITIAVPSFISLLVMNKMLSPSSASGLINSWLVKQDWFVGFSQQMGWGSMAGDGWTTTGIPFIRGPGSGDNWAIIPKLTVIIVNIWIGIPFTVLSTSGILMNIPSDLYESSQIDGAGPFRQLVSITLPYIFFVTGPSLITSFVGNINNFNVIFFLTGGEPRGVNDMLTSGAGETSLLITWLYTLATDTQQQNYALGSVLGIIIFILCGFFSLVAYSRLGSVQNEEAFQ